MDKEVLLSNPKGCCTEKYIRLHFPEEYCQVQKCDGDRFAEKLYNYWYNDGVSKKCYCGKPAHFKSIGQGYSEYCSNKCAAADKKRIEKIKQTTLKRYRVANASQSDIIKEKKKETTIKHFGGLGFGSKTIADKSNSTILKKYGVVNVSQSDAVKEKKHQTSLEKYGVGHIMQLNDIKEKAKQTCLDRYGVTNIFKLERVKQKARDNYYEKCFKHDDYVMSIHDTNSLAYTCFCPHSGCNKCREKTFEIKPSIYRDRLRLGTELCTKLLPEQPIYSTFEIFIRNILDEQHIKYTTNDRSIISPLELDIYIPDHNLAIECNGVYWHSSYKKESEYHYCKFISCQSKGIQLLTFWEDQYHNKPEIIKSIILSKLGIYEHKLGARECTVYEIDHEISSSFINLYHIQGSTNSKVRLGLYYNDELVSVMTFSHRKGLQGRGKITWVLDRYCVKSGYLITGGASKLMKYFIKQYDPNEIVSFASNDISNGNLYEQLGFIRESDFISYWYVDVNMKRYHRSSFSKASIIKKGWKKVDDKNWTESQVMKDHNMFKIYDSGTTKYVYYK